MWSLFIYHIYNSGHFLYGPNSLVSLHSLKLYFVFYETIVSYLSHCRQRRVLFSFRSLPLHHLLRIYEDYTMAIRIFTGNDNSFTWGKRCAGFLAPILLISPHYYCKSGICKRYFIAIGMTLLSFLSVYSHNCLIYVPFTVRLIEIIPNVKSALKHFCLKVMSCSIASWSI